MSPPGDADAVGEVGSEPTARRSVFKCSEPRGQDRNELYGRSSLSKEAAPKGQAHPQAVDALLTLS